MIKLHQVSKKYLGHTALDQISFSIPKGKIIGLVGPNGSGKSTTLKLLCGLIQPTKGTIEVLGQEVNRRSSSFIAYLSEQDAYYPFYTVQETIDFFATQFADFNREKAEEVLQFMKLDPQQKVKHLSKGNRGRLRLVLTLAREVPLILMDEPLSGLDPMVRDSIIKSLLSFIDLEKQTVMMATHEINEIEPLLDGIIAIQKGKVLAQLDLDELRTVHHKSIVEWMKEVYN